MRRNIKTLCGYMFFLDFEIQQVNSYDQYFVNLVSPMCFTVAGKCDIPPTLCGRGARWKRTTGQCWPARGHETIARIELVHFGESDRTHVLGFILDLVKDPAH